MAPVRSPRGLLAWLSGKGGLEMPQPGTAWTDSFRRKALMRVVMPAVVLVLILQAPAEAGRAVVIRHGPRWSHGVALTFDDGWGEASCARIARILRRKGVTATFFINGVHLRAQPARWRRILKGFPVANHTVSHANLTTVSAGEVKRQILRDEKVHRMVLGRPLLKVLRPPYGAYNQRVLRIAGRLGYHYVLLWNRTAADTSPAATVRSIVRHTIGAPRGSVILMHCARSVTADALPAVIRSYKRRGIPLIGLDEMFGLTP